MVDAFFTHYFVQTFPPPTLHTPPPSYFLCFTSLHLSVCMMRHLPALLGTYFIIAAAACRCLCALSGKSSSLQDSPSPPPPSPSSAVGLQLYFCTDPHVYDECKIPFITKALKDVHRRNFHQDKVECKVDYR